jgi:hypothetical protein
MQTLIHRRDVGHDAGMIFKPDLINESAMADPFGSSGTPIKTPAK